MNKKEGSNMKDELKYPRVFVLQKMIKEAYINYNSFDEILGYVVSPCYLINETISYDRDGASKKTYEVVFPRHVDAIYYDYIDGEGDVPHINCDTGCMNSVKVDFVTTDYDKAIKLRDKKIKEEVFNGINLFLPLEPFETYNDRCSEYMDKIEKYQQRLNETEPKEQVKKKIKTPLK